jgi:hypothetical protein
LAAFTIASPSHLVMSLRVQTSITGQQQPSDSTHGAMHMHMPMHHTMQ